VRRYEQPLPQGLHLLELPNHWLPKQLFHWLWEWKVVSVEEEALGMQGASEQPFPA